MRAWPGPGSMVGSSTTESTSGPPNEAAITTDGMPAPTSPSAPCIPPSAPCIPPSAPRIPPSAPGIPPPAAPAPGLLRLAAAGASPPLALVHRLHPGDRDGVAFRDQIGAQPLRRGHLAGPWIAAGEQGGRGVHGEVGRRHAL